MSAAAVSKTKFEEYLKRPYGIDYGLKRHGLLKRIFAGAVLDFIAAPFDVFRRKYQGSFADGGGDWLLALALGCLGGGPLMMLLAATGSPLMLSMAAPVVTFAIALWGNTNISLIGQRRRWGDMRNETLLYDAEKEASNKERGSGMPSIKKP